MRDFTIPGKAIPKQRPRAMIMKGHVHMYTPEKTREYEARVRECYLEDWDGMELMSGPVKASITVSIAPNKSETKKNKAAMLEGLIKPIKKSDLDNIVKSVLDGLNGYAYKDDSQIVEIAALKRYSDIDTVEVTLEEV